MPAGLAWPASVMPLLQPWLQWQRGRPNSIPTRHKETNMDTAIPVSPFAVMPVPVAAAGAPSVASARPKRKKPRVWTGFTVLIIAFVGGNVFCELIAGTIAGYVYASGAAAGLEPAQIDEQWHALVNGTFLGFALSIVPLQLFMGFVGVLAAVYSPVSFRQRVGLVKPAMPKLGWPATSSRCRTCDRSAGRRPGDAACRPVGECRSASGQRSQRRLPWRWCC